MSRQRHWPIVFIRPAETLPCLDEALDEFEPFGLVVDLTRGKMQQRLGSVAMADRCDILSFSRIRRVDDGSLSTTGHTVSVAVPELQEELREKDISRVLVLDDTSFSGTTSILAEDVLEKVGVSRTDITHGFMIVNVGELAPGVPGALQRLGSVAAGYHMMTPRDDGWHIFDIVRQDGLASHLENVQHALHHPECEASIFTHSIAEKELRDCQEAGTFVASSSAQMQGSHTKNPQLLPRIMQAGHIDPPSRWRMSEDEVFGLLLEIGQLLDGENGNGNRKN